MTCEVELYGSSALREKSVPVDTVDDGIRELAKAMIATMYASRGIGLAAEQVGRRESVCVIDLTGAGDREDGEPAADPAIPMPLVLLNPEITEMTGEQVAPEGCLSFPELYIKVKRAEQIHVTYVDLDGEDRELDATGLLSRALQHEIDHLNGILFIDRVSATQRATIAGRLRRLKKAQAGR